VDKIVYDFKKPCGKVADHSIFSLSVLLKNDRQKIEQNPSGPFRHVFIFVFCCLRPWPEGAV